MTRHSLSLGLIAVTVVAAVVLPWFLAADAAASPPMMVDAARVLAENVLGRGMVRSIRASPDGSQIMIRWESPTYHPDNGLIANRELIYGEAVLATSAILGQLRQVLRIRFTIMSGTTMLATGENRRGHGVALMLSTDLGGGAYVPLTPAVEQPSTPGGAAAQEI